MGKILDFFMFFLPYFTMFSKYFEHHLPGQILSAHSHWFLIKKRLGYIGMEKEQFFFWTFL